MDLIQICLLWDCLQQAPFSKTFIQLSLFTQNSVEIWNYELLRMQRIAWSYIEFKEESLYVKKGGEFKNCRTFNENSFDINWKEPEEKKTHSILKLIQYRTIWESLVVLEVLLLSHRWHRKQWKSMKHFIAEAEPSIPALLLYDLFYSKVTSSVQMKSTQSNWN